MKTGRMLWLWLVFCLAPSVALGAGGSAVPPGRPFQALQDQINALRARIEALQASAGKSYAVYDSVNRKVGDVIGMSEIRLYPSPASLYQTDYEYPIVVIEYDNKLITLAVTRDNFYSLGNILRYTTPDCTGQAYAHVDQLYDSGASPAAVMVMPSPLPIAVLPLYGSMVYIEAGAPVSIAEVTFLSHKIREGECSQVPAPHRSQYLFHVPVDPLIDLSTLFTPPFEVRR